MIYCRKKNCEQEGAISTHDGTLCVTHAIQTLGGYQVQPIVIDILIAQQQRLAELENRLKYHNHVLQ